MSIEVGSVVKGKVTGITKFGVFVELEDGKTGMVHISEVAATYVQEIRDYVTDGQEVTVKVINVSPEGKIGLSMKQAVEGYEESGNRRGRSGQNASGERRGRSGGFNGGFSERQAAEPCGFDEMLSRFMQSSDEKISSMRKNTGERRTSRRGAGGRQG